MPEMRREYAECSFSLVAGDVFLGFAEQNADNSAGAAGAVNVRVIARGRAKLAIATLAITSNVVRE